MENLVTTIKTYDIIALYLLGLVTWPSIKKFEFM